MADRVDASRVRDLDPFHSIVPYVMPKRTEAEVSLTQHYDVTDLLSYMEKRNVNEGTQLKLFHALCTAFARTLVLRPKLNIFLAGKRYWMRKDILLSFVVKQQFADNAEETLMTLKVTPDMTLDQISEKILGSVSRVREEKSNDLDGTMRFVGKLPRFVLEILFWFLRVMEYFGIFPESLMKGDPNYSTALISNLGSIQSGSAYHHLSNYGTCSILITIGVIRKEAVIQNGGATEERNMLDITYTLDERIADGFYFAKSIRIIKLLIENPEMLMQPLKAEIDVESL